MTPPIRPFFSKALRAVIASGYGRTKPKPVRNFLGRIARSAPAGEYGVIDDRFQGSSLLNRPMTRDEFIAKATDENSVLGRLESWNHGRRWSGEQMPGWARSSQDSRMIAVGDPRWLGSRERWTTHTENPDLVHTRSLLVRSPTLGRGRAIFEIQSDLSQDKYGFAATPKNFAAYKQAELDKVDLARQHQATLDQYDRMTHEFIERNRQAAAAALGRSPDDPSVDALVYDIAQDPRLYRGEAERGRRGIAEIIDLYNSQLRDPRDEVNARLGPLVRRLNDAKQRASRPPTWPVSPWTADRRWVKLGIGNELLSGAEEGLDFLTLPNVADRVAATDGELPLLAAQLTYGKAAPRYLREILTDLGQNPRDYLRRFSTGQKEKETLGVRLTPELRRAILTQGVPAFGVGGLLMQSGDN